MEEFIFGTVAIDDLKLVHHRVSHSGVQHADEIRPRDPGPDRPVTLQVRLGPEVKAARVVCYFTTDGSEPRGARGIAQHGHVIALERVRAEWDSFQWGYVVHWQGQLPPQEAGTTVRYRIGAWHEGGEEIFADFPDVKASTDRSAGAFFQGKELKSERVGDPARGRTFSYQVDAYRPPQWARQAVLYQIFVDRFFPGKGRDWQQTSDLHDFFGGTLWGVTEKLDYIAALGATCIWLSPIFPSPTTHGYDATDFSRVSDRVGGDQALQELVQAAHARGLRVILDLVCNHTSNQHPFFQEALRNPESPYRDWYFFDDPVFDYRTFFGVTSMPQLNMTHPPARDYMLDIARYWLEEFDVDGYRLDHANGPGPSFWSDFWRTCKQAKDDSFCFGEVVEPSHVLQRYIGRMDGTLDFLLADSIRRTFGYESMTEQAFAQFLQAHLVYYPQDFLLLTFVDNHDMDRFLYLSDENKDKLKRVATIQMKLPGPPIIYYGTEVGMSQTVSKASKVGLEASRMAMVWDERQDRELLEFYKALLRQRAQRKPWAQRDLNVDALLKG